MTRERHCEIRVRDLNPGTLITLSGVLDEQTEIGDVAASVKAPVQIDLSGVRYITSLGLMTWIRLLKLLQEHAPIGLVRCSPTMIAQFSMVTDALTGARVESLEAPYACSQCGVEESRLLRVPEDFPQGSSTYLAPFLCSRCGAAMVFDDLPDRFLAFLDE